MGKRTSKKDKKITLIDVKEPMNISELFEKRNKFWDRLMRKVRNNSQVGEFHLPIVEDFPARLDEHAIERGYLRDYFVGYTGQARCSHIPPGFTGRCSICKLLLTEKFPEDFPTEWRICCFCLRIAKVFTQKHEVTFHGWGELKINKIKKLINLVG
ncbi:hypothetical protein LCGC14_0770420 [marine sediment metagenome]|uniref:Uncharacterized protein n=1 Tax=marine sediment metagenome TaxID=412755 RepID=A0A0F9SIG8_9ZZZZ